MTRILEADHTFILPDLVPGTLFVMQDALPQVTGILESAGITQIEEGVHIGQRRNIFGITPHTTYLDLHSRHPPSSPPSGPQNH